MAAALALAVIVLGMAACGDGGGEETDPVRAVVNGHEVRQSAVAAVRAEARLTDEKDDAGEALDQAIEREIIRREADRLGVTVDAAAVDERAAAVTEELGGEAALGTALEEAGMSREQLRASLEAAVLLSELRAAKYPEIASTVAAARAFYERRRADLFTQSEAVNLGAILIRNEGIAGNALKRLRAGRPFAEVARQFSIDPELKANAGRLGWVDPASLPGKLGAAVTKLPLRRVSEPIAGSGGVWIFKVLERRAASVTPFAEVREDILEQLTARKRSKALQRWVEAALKQAEIKKL